jgi:FkbM family methyltransferase
VGANFGDYTYALAKIARNVEAFEPLDRCAAVIEAARLPGVQVHRVALSDQAGERTLHLPLQGGRPDTGRASFLDPGGTRERTVVPVRSLDSYGFRDVGLIKIDVEGHESAVLAGAAETIRACRPVLIVEIEQRHRRDCSIDTVFAGILALGYSGSFLEGGARRPLAAFSFARHQEPFIELLAARERDPCHPDSRISPGDAGKTCGTREDTTLRNGGALACGPFSFIGSGGRAILGRAPRLRYVNNFIFLPQA